MVRRLLKESCVRTEIISTGMYVPSRVVTNHDLATMMETSDEWIVQRTGIRERRWVETPGTGAAALAEPAARMALERASLTPADVDAIVFATLSPDHYFPGSGVLLAARLGLTETPALDVRNQCSGFLYALQVADGWIRTGTYRRVLVVGSEVHSAGLDMSTRGRDVACIFGDGAAAVLLGPTDDESRGIRRIKLAADGRFASDLWLEGMGSAFPHIVDEAQLAEGKQWPTMEGPKVFKHAITKMPAVTRAVLEAEGVSPADLRLVIAHQANLRIAEAVQKSLGLRDDQVFNNIERYGNTTAASIPLALHEALEAGRASRGDWVAFTSFGSGFTWGAALVRW
jgi:3-oxoacyl-[acyl-carrier-protein] synthase-3